MRTVILYICTYLSIIHMISKFWLASIPDYIVMFFFYIKSRKHNKDGLVMRESFGVFFIQNRFRLRESLTIFQWVIKYSATIAHMRLKKIEPICIPSNWEHFAYLIFSKFNIFLHIYPPNFATHWIIFCLHQN